MTEVDRPVLVAGMELPSALTDAIVSGRWIAPADPSILEAVFRCELVQPRLYSFNGIVSETEHWRSISEDDTLKAYLGAPSETEPPGDIDQFRSVLIGDLGPDIPFALDYRASGEPSVVLLPPQSGWREVAPDVRTLIASLKL